MALSQNLTSVYPELQDLLNAYKKDVFLSLNCHHLGTIQEFNAVNQTAQVTINYKKTLFLPNAAGVFSPTTFDYPLLADVPVIILGGGGYNLTLPIAKGDQCMLLFNDRDIDNWAVGNESAGTATSRLHSMADAFALVGIKPPVSDFIPNYDTDGAALRNKLGTTKVKVYDDHVEIKVGAATVTVDATKVNAVLTPGVEFEYSSDGKLKITNLAGGDFMAAILQIFNDISTGTVATMLGPQLLTMPTFAADILKVESFKP